MTRLLALAALAAAALAVAGGGSASGGGRTIDLVLPKTTSMFDADLGAKGYSPGDYFLVTGPLLDRVGGSRVGGLAGVWTIVSPKADDVSATIHLAKGNISLEGTLRHDVKRSAFRVVGGTGAFARAHGSATVRYLTASSLALHIELS